MLQPKLVSKHFVIFMDFSNQNGVTKWSDFDELGVDRKLTLPAF